MSEGPGARGQGPEGKAQGPGPTAQGPEGKLPVHGFVLAGGKSSRMGADKALLNFCGRALVEIAIEKLRGFCAEVSVAGNRDDLSRFAPVVHEERVDCGPAAGIEAGLKASKQEWAMFVPVDVPLVPGELLRRWAEEVTGLRKDGMGASFLVSNAGREPMFCLVRRDCVVKVSEALDNGERRLDEVLLSIDGSEGDSWVQARSLAGYAEPRPSDLEIERWFSNLNSPNEFDVAAGWEVKKQIPCGDDNKKSKSKDKSKGKGKSKSKSKGKSKSKSF